MENTAHKLRELIRGRSFIGLADYLGVNINTVGHRIKKNSIPKRYNRWIVEFIEWRAIDWQNLTDLLDDFIPKKYPYEPKNLQNPRKKQKQTSTSLQAMKTK